MSGGRDNLDTTRTPYDVAGRAVPVPTLAGRSGEQDNGGHSGGVETHSREFVDRRPLELEERKLSQHHRGEEYKHVLGKPCAGSGSGG